MKKFCVLALASTLILGIGTSSVNAASASVTSRKSDNAAKEATLTGEGKYVKFTCTYSGSTTSFGSDGYCNIIRTSSDKVSTLEVGGTSSKVKSTDYYMDKGVKYILQADVETTAPSGSAVTAAVR